AALAPVKLRKKIVCSVQSHVSKLSFTGTLRLHRSSDALPGLTIEVYIRSALRRMMCLNNRCYVLSI
ncbi:MAG: hypothetical protein ACRD3W_05110, partial [Terriglobales bacterium]